MKGLKPNGAPAKPGVPDSVCGPSLFHQLKPNGVWGVGNWLPNWPPNWLANWLANGELNQLDGVHCPEVWFHGLKPWKPLDPWKPVNGEPKPPKDWEVQPHGVFHAFPCQSLLADHGVEFQP